MSETELIEKIYGVGEGDFGYGQSLVDAATALARISSHQGISIPRLVADGANTPNLIIEKLEETRLQAAGDSLAMVPSCLEHLKDAAWSRPHSETVEARFSNEDKARHFFNTGGTLTLRVMHSQSRPTQLDQDFIETLQRLGTIYIGAWTTRSSNGVSTPVGFYSLDKSEIKMWDDGNILLIGKRVGYRGKRGGNGNGIQFFLTVRPPPHRVGNALSPGTQIVWGYTRASTYLEGVIPPVYRNTKKL